VVLDRIAVTVGRLVILESTVVLDVRVSAFLDQKPVELSGEAKRKAADRLVDRALILREAAELRLALANEADAERLLAQVKAPYGSQGAYEAALARYEITEAQLRQHLVDGYRALRFTDRRFAPEVQVSETDLREFYQLLAAGWRRTGEAPAFEEAREEVRRLVTGQKVMQALDAWLSSTRIQAGVQYRDKVFE
jgi:hypothetical protein